MNLEPLNGKFRARYYRVGHVDSVCILADAMRSNVRRSAGILSPEEHRVELFYKGEKVAQLLLLPGEAVLLFHPVNGIIDEAREPAKIEGVIESRTKADSWPTSYTDQYVSGSISTPLLQSIDGTLYGRTCTGRPITDREAAGEPAFIKTDRTVYTVPPHVGQNIEVPNGSVITTYDPKARGL